MNALPPVAALVALVVSACEVPPEVPPATPPPVHLELERAPEPVTKAPSDVVQLAVAEASGLDPAVVGKFYAAARESLGHCHQPGGGTVRVRIVKQGPSLHMHIEPGATLDPLAHRCVLEALSTVDIPDTAANTGGPAVPPTGFTSLITLSW